MCRGLDGIIRLLVKKIKKAGFFGRRKPKTIVFSFIDTNVFEELLIRPQPGRWEGDDHQKIN